MMYTPHRSLCAAVAISAALALGSSPAIGQEAAAPVDLAPAIEASPPEPVVILPEDPVPAAPVPTVILPSVPVVETEPSDTVADTSEPVAAKAGQSAERPAVAAVAPSVQPEPVAGQQVNPPADIASDADDGAASAVSTISDRRPATFAEAAPESGSPEPFAMDDEALAALVGILGLGGVAGFLAMRSRRRRRQPGEMASVAPVSALADKRLTAPEASLPEADDRQPVAGFAMASPAGAPIAGAKFELPQGPVPTGEARQALLDRMVVAPPDKANPFTSRKARRKRARIILQHREHVLRRQATEPFDWRTYKPSIRRDILASPTGSGATTPISA